MAQETEERKQQQSPVEKAANIAQTARFFVLTIRGAGTAATALGAAWWVPVVAIGIGIFVFILTLAGGNLTGTTPTAQAGPEVTITPTVSPIPVGEAGQAIANKAREVAEQLYFCDTIGASSRGSSFHCWSEMRMYNQVGPIDLDYLQCTEFVWAVFDKAGFGEEIDLIRQFADAAGWPNEARRYPNIFHVFLDAGRLLPGDIVSLGKQGEISDTSHLAIVTYTAPDVSYVVVAQSATDKPYDETWPIQNGRINAQQYVAQYTREEVKGFIRLIGRAQ